MSNELCEGLTFRRYQGDTWILPFQVTNADGDPITITGATAVVFAVFDEESRTEIFRRDLDSDPSPITLATNVITVIVPDTVTDALEPGQYLFEMEIVDASGYRQTIASGTATVVEDLINA